MSDDYYNFVELIRDDLLITIKQEGFTAPKVRSLTNLLALGFRERTVRIGRNVEYHGLLIAFTAVAAKLDERGQALGIRHVIGSMPVGRMMSGLMRIGEFSGLSNRSTLRRQQLSDIVWQHEGPTAATVARYESSLCMVFAQALLEASANPADLSAKLEPKLEKAEPPATDMTRVWQKSVFHVDRRRVIYRVDMRIQLRANRDGADTYAVWHEYYTDTRPGVIHTIDPIRATILEQRDVIYRGHVTYLKTITPLQLNETREVGLTTHVRTDRVARTSVLGKFLHSASDDVSEFQVAFDPGAMPVEVWWFRMSEGHTEYEKPSGTDLTPTSDGYVRYKFPNVTLGEIFGICWMWAESELTVKNNNVIK